MVAGGKHGESRQHHDPLAPDMYKKLGGASVMLRHFARLHEGVKLYGQAEHALREFKLNDPWYVKPTERDGRGWAPSRRFAAVLKTIADMLENGLETQVEPFPETDKEFSDILVQVRQLKPSCSSAVF